MGPSQPLELAGYAYDPETVDLLQKVLDEVWAQLTEMQRKDLPRSLIADRLLRAAATGERNPDLLRIHARDGVGSATAPAKGTERQPGRM